MSGGRTAADRTLPSGGGARGPGGRWLAPDPEGPIPAAPGAYLLEFVLPGAVRLHVGSLGALALPPGRYRYAGSARGPGGIRARVRRHLDPAGRRDRWHVDALTRAVPVAAVLPVPGGDEHGLVRELVARGWTAPVPRFGATDCRGGCPAHLLRAPDPPVAAPRAERPGGRTAPGG